MRIYCLSNLLTILIKIKVMATNSKSLKASRVFGPGEIIANELSSRGWTQEDFAKSLGVSNQTVNNLIKNKTKITNEIATSLGGVLGQSPEFWLKIDNRYRAVLKIEENDLVPA
jgi:addiction module HigA family antidote